SDPAEPMDKIDPAEPIDKIEPDEPIDKMDPLEPMLKIGPVFSCTRFPDVIAPLSTTGGRVAPAGGY
ncbi:MAG TPA: hypothetical protein VHF26_05850, partial [Trebonia sp.]|nr:hypothetical protein [Trebonia sp.]